MQAVLLLTGALGLAPLALGAVLLRRAPGEPAWPGASSVLLSALAFNLTFFWQELWLVAPKAVTPGLHPVLYHNDHSWTGQSPVAELLQGTGAVATVVSGLVALVLLARLPRAGATWRLFLFWMAFQGLFQSITQVAVGCVVPGNDVGRALAYLGAEAWQKALLLVGDCAAMALAGWGLAVLRPAGIAAHGPTLARGFAAAMLVTVALSVLLVIPFREPRDLVEVALVPAVVNLVGAGWLVLATAVGRWPAPRSEPAGAVLWPSMALVALLAVFQIVLRPGVKF